MHVPTNIAPPIMAERDIVWTMKLNVGK